MGLGKRVQAILVGVSAGLGAFALLPQFQISFPPEYGVPIAVTAWLASIVASALRKR